MQSNRTRTFLLLFALAILAALALPHPASAQCGLLRQDFLNISLETGNAFVADYFTNTRSPILGVNGSPINTGLKSVARDSEGRVRIVRSAGKYIVKETDGVATEVERLSIIICDPTTFTMTTLDTANKTATVQPPRSSLQRIIRPEQGKAGPFCARLIAMERRFLRFSVEDLGHQTISAYDTVGIRIHYAPLGATAGESAPSSYNELWCSDVLGVVVQQTNESKSQRGSEFKRESTMQNIEHREPEISLFQIPSDYTILQRDASADRRPLPRSIPAPSDTKPQ